MVEFSSSDTKYWTHDRTYKLDLLQRPKIRRVGRFTINFYWGNELVQNYVIIYMTHKDTTSQSFIPKGAKFSFLHQFQLDHKTFFQSGFEKGTPF